MQKAVLVVLLLLTLFLASPGMASGCTCPAGCPVCEPLQVGMDASLSKSVLEYGESANVSILVRNSEPNITSLGCDYAVQGQSGAVQNVTNDGQWHQIGTTQVTAPDAAVDHQVAVGVSVDVSCAAQLSNDTGLAWCGNGCSSFAMAYYYPSFGTIAAYREAQLNAVNKLSLARSAFAAAESMIARAESANSQSPYLNQSIEKLGIADGFLTAASFMYDQTAFNQSALNSESATVYAHDAEALAYLAYGVASPSTAYNYVMRLIDETQGRGGRIVEDIARVADAITMIAGMPGTGIGGSFRPALERERKNIEEANRLLEEARKRLREGNYTGAADSALSAKTIIEKAREAIGSLFPPIKRAFVNAIAGTYSSLLSEIEDVSARLNAASIQRGVNLEEIKIGRTNVGYARNRAAGASLLVSKVADSQDMPELISSSSAALLELRGAFSHVQEARFHAYLSMIRKYIAIAVISGGAALLAALVWWMEKRKEERPGDEKAALVLEAPKEPALGLPMSARKKKTTGKTERKKRARKRKPAKKKKMTGR